MSVTYALYGAIKSVCPKSYRGTFSIFQEKVEKSYAVFFRGGVPSSRRMADGAYLERTASITFNVNASKNAKGVLEGYKFCEEVVRALETTVNYPFTDTETGATVRINSVEVLGDVNALGNNPFDIPTFSMNFIIKYIGGNKNE